MHKDANGKARVESHLLFPIGTDAAIAKEGNGVVDVRVERLAEEF